MQHRRFSNEGLSATLMVTTAFCLLGLETIAGAGQAATGPTRASEDAPPLELFFQAASPSDDQAEEALRRISQSWKDGYTAMILDLAVQIPPAPPPPRGGDPVFGGGGFGATAPQEGGAAGDVTRLDSGGPAVSPRGGSSPGGPAFSGGQRPHFRVRERLTRFLNQQTGQRFGNDLGKWQRWLWALPYQPHPEYARYKGMAFANIDPRMQQFLPGQTLSLIRLDEVLWGGVSVNGIPPLDHPGHITAKEASYLKDKNIVFGIVLNGEARAYPKRILGWHEMALDKLGGVELTLVYCTLCGTAIPYRSEVGGQHRTFGTSGLLYRSNKLMFDQETKSLWSTLLGRPVVGQLAGSELQLESLPIVTTRWGEWKAQHPETTVLSLETGYERDYAEGAAYRDYFSNDRLMFEVPDKDKRLKNKDEVLVLRLVPESGVWADGQPLAISTKFLRKNTVFHTELAGHRLVIVTTKEGAHRVYDTGDQRFTQRLKDGSVKDSNRKIWRVTEEALISDKDAQARLARLPAQRAFWFGWYAQFPNTQLIK